MKTIKQLMLSMGMAGTYFAAQGTICNICHQDHEGPCPKRPCVAYNEAHEDNEDNMCDFCDERHEGACPNIDYLNFLGNEITGLEHLPIEMNIIDKIITLINTAPLNSISLNEVKFVLGMKAFTSGIHSNYKPQGFINFLGDIQHTICCKNDALWFCRKINKLSGLELVHQRELYEDLVNLDRLDLTLDPAEIEQPDPAMMAAAVDQSVSDTDDTSTDDEPEDEIELLEETQVDFFGKLRTYSTIEQECILCTVREVCLGLGIDTNYDLLYKRQDNSLNTNILRLIAAHVNGSTDFLRVDAALQAYANRLHERK